MIIYYSMIIWIVITWIVALAMPSIVYTRIEGRIRVKLGYAVFTMAFIILAVGLRSSVGDTYAYINIYSELPTSIDSTFWDTYPKDRGFFILSVYFKKLISSNYTAWFFLISCICGIAVARTLSRFSENFFFSMYLFIAMAHFVWMFNGMRQFIAVSLFFANISLLREQKFFKYAILTIILSMIHITAIVMIPLYFIATAKPWGKRFGFALIIMLVAGFSIDRIADTFSYVLEDSAYEGYLTAAATSVGSNIFRTLVAAAPPVLALLCKRYTEGANNRILDISINMSCLSAVLYYCSAQSGGILIGRMPIYFDVYNLLLLPWLVENCFTERSKRVVYIGLILAYFAFFYSKVKIGMDMGYSSELLGISF